MRKLKFYDNNKKVLAVLPSAQCGGAERVILSIIRNLDATLFEPIILTIDNEGIILDGIKGNIPKINMNRKRVRDAFIPMVRVIRSIRPNYIITSICHLNVAVLLLKYFIPNGIKIIIRESNFLSCSLKMSKYERLLKYLVKMLYPKANCIICLCDEMKNDLVNNFNIPSNKILVIPNPVDTGCLKRKALNKPNPYLQSEHFNLLAVGSLTHQKGFDILIDAMDHLLSEKPDIFLTILGNGHLKDKLKQHIAERDLTHHITLAGFKKNPYPYFFYADRFILSSRYEGLPNVALEAIALGTPVIAFDSPGCIRDIQSNTSSLTLVTPFTARALSKSITNSLTHSDNLDDPLLPEKYELNNVIQRYQEIFI